MLNDGPIGKQSAYHIIEKETTGAAFHRGDEVRIAGEPGLRFYRVVATEPSRSMVTVMDASGGTYRLPESSLRMA